MRILVVPAVAAILLFGLWIAAGKITNDYGTSIGLSVAWFVVASAVLGKLSKRYAPSLRNWVRAGTILTSLTVLAWFWWTSIRETTVDEQVVTGVPAMAAERAPAPAGGEPRRRVNVVVAKGDVESLAHSGRGRAQVVELAAGGRKLTLTDFDIDPGPQVVVRLQAGGDAHVDLGDLKGSRGNQQYAIPDDVDLDRYTEVVFWCVPFSQALARAQLRPA